MKSLVSIFKNLFPYLFLIAIYFFFVNLEARKEQLINESYNKNMKKNVNKLNNNINLRISIPIIPYNQK